MLCETNPQTRCSIWSPPIRIAYPDGKRYKTIVFVCHYDGKGYKTNVFLFIAMADVIKPMLVFYDCDGKRCKTSASSLIAIERYTTNVFLFIAMANAIKPMLF